jgi:hypothetical protein
MFFKFVFDWPILSQIIKSIKMENISDKIKLPSNWMLVNPESIWRYLSTIARTGSIFTKEQLINAGLYTTNEDNISRNLAYLKYLDIVEEERGKGKDQRFKVIDRKEVKDVLYELKANREQQAKTKFKALLESHALFDTLKKDFFGSEKQRTLNDLEHFLRDGMPGKGPQYYQKGGEFLIKLLQLAELAHLVGNDITLADGHANGVTQIEDPQGEKKMDIRELEKPRALPAVTTSFEEVQIIPQNTYVIQFTGPGLNSKLEIQEADDLLIVEATLAKIRKKLTQNEAN